MNFPKNIILNITRILVNYNMDFQRIKDNLLINWKFMKIMDIQQDKTRNKTTIDPDFLYLQT